MEEGKKSVILYTEWAKPLAGLPLEEKGRIFDAILNYTDNGSTPIFENPATEMAFLFIKMRLDENLGKWNDIREKRRLAGRRGAESTNNKKSANPANADFAEMQNGKSRQRAANPAVNVNVNVNGNVSSSSSKSPSEVDDEDAPAGATMETTISPESFWMENGLGKSITPSLKERLTEYRRQGVEDPLIVQAMREAVEHNAKAPLPYMRKVLDQAVAAGELTLEVWQARHLAYKPKGRVDRPEPSGNDFLRDAAERPRRLKRKD